MDASQRLSAKAALRLACFKDLRLKDLEQQAVEQPQQVAKGGAEKQNAKNVVAPVNPGTPEFAEKDWGRDVDVPKKARDAVLPSKAHKFTEKDWARDLDMPPATQVPMRAEMPPVTQALINRAEFPPVAKAPVQKSGGLPSIGAAAVPAAAPVQNPFIARSRPQNEDFRSKQLPQAGFGVKRDFRISQDSFGAKRELRTPMEDSPMAGEDSFEDHHPINRDMLRPAPLQQGTPKRQGTPQAVDMYRLPWENSAPEDAGMAEYTRTPTPIFGSGPQKGFLADPRSTNGAAGGPTAKNAKPPIASAAKWQSLGMRESRWSGA